MSALHFVLPSPLDDDSQAYVRQIADALRSQDHQVSVSLVATVVEAEAALADIPHDKTVVLDGAVLRMLETISVAQLARSVVLVRDCDVLLSGQASAGWIKDRVLRQLAKVVATSAMISDRLVKELALPADRVCVVTPGVHRRGPPRPAAASILSMDAQPTCCQLLSVGPIMASSGHDRLVQTLARLPDLDWGLTIAGQSPVDPDCLAALRQMLDTVRPSGRAKLLERPSLDQLDALWGEADVFASAARCEICDEPVMEALSRGLPVATMSGGRWVVDGAGAVCRSDDLDGLSKSLRRMIFDLPLRGAMSKAAWAAGQKLPSWSDQSRLLLQCLEL